MNLNQIDPAHHRTFAANHLIDCGGGGLIPIQPG
jgi:hypothetical protein